MNTVIRHAFSAGLFSILFLSPALAQGAPEVPEGKGGPTKSDDVVTLSVFQVDASRDTGYAAKSTLAGTRFSTSLADIAASVSVLTPDFLADIGLHTLNEAATFVPSVDRNPAAADNINFQFSGARIRGIAVTENSIDYFTVNMPSDEYNLEQMTANKGPNSLLFGVGNPAGILSSISKRADFRQRGRLYTEYGRYNASRFTLDYNLPVVPKRFALRLNLLHRDTDTFRESTEWKEDRAFLAGTANLLKGPSAETTLRFNTEFANAHRILGRLLTPIDAVTRWQAAGGPTLDAVRPAAAPAVLPTSLVNASGQNSIVVVDGSQQSIPVLNWINTVRGNNTVTNSGFGPGSPIPLDVNYYGPVRSSNYRSRSYTFFLEQTIGRDFSVELASWDNRTIIPVGSRGGGGDTVTVDANRLLPNGAPNPNVGKLYTEGTMRSQNWRHSTREQRLTAAYAHDAGHLHRWLGEQRLGVLLTHRVSDSAFDDLLEVNTTPLTGFNARLDNAQNRIVRRTYLFNGNGNVWLPTGKLGDFAPINSGGINSALLPVQNVSHNINKVDSAVAGLQSYLFDKRLTLTGGVRHDDLKSYGLDPAIAVRDARGVFPSWEQLPVASAPLLAFAGNTTTIGGVWHAVRGLSFSANRSETFDTASSRPDWFGRSLPIASGYGRDFGVRVDLFENRLTGSLTRFESGIAGQQTFGSQAIGTRVSDIGNGLNRQDLVISSLAADTQDTDAKGWELEVVYNPTPQWRISLNGAKLENRLANITPRSVQFLQDKVYPVESTNGAVRLASGRTVAQEIALIRTDVINNKTSLEGQPATELREWTGNLVTNYAFATGALRGVSVGGYVQYRGPSILGAYLDPVTKAANQSRPIRDHSYSLVGLNLGYTYRLEKKRELQFRLNVRNLFNEQRLLGKSADATTGQILTWQVQEPLKWTLSSALTF